MATLIKGMLSFNLDWQYVLVGVFIAITIELCGINALSFAVGAYLPLSTTLPIFAGGAIKGIINWREKQKAKSVEEEEIAPGNLFATGLVAGGAIAGVIVAILTVSYTHLPTKLMSTCLNRIPSPTIFKGKRLSMSQSSSIFSVATLLVKRLSTSSMQSLKLNS